MAMISIGIPTGKGGPLGATTCVGLDGAGSQAEMTIRLHVFTIMRQPWPVNLRELNRDMLVNAGTRSASVGICGCYRDQNLFSRI
jgi:hypothetical protein